jgi:hypothetical protein
MFYSLFKILFIIIIIFVYLHVYIHFSVNPSNKMNELEDVTKQSITDTVYMKLPFLFNGTSIMNPVENKMDVSSNKYYKTYSLIYKSIPLLEPSVRFYSTDTLIEIHKKNKCIPIERNLECRNFYMVHSGRATITCIHPKYKDHFINGNVKDDIIKNNDNFIHLELYPNSVLFVPNYWYVHIESLEKDTTIQKIQYSTILNQVCFQYEKLTKEMFNNKQT